MTSPVLLLNVDELWLKGKNRPNYFKRICQHISKICREFYGQNFSLKNENQRIVLSGPSEFTSDFLKTIASLPGLFSVEPAMVCPADQEKIKEAADIQFAAFQKRHLGDKTFRITSSRAFKDFSLSSMELNRMVGGSILQKFKDWKVNLRNPALEMQIKVAGPQTVYLSCQKISATGGLPVGSSGKLITLLSGGLDSPVASYLMSARGCQQSFVFFHSYPFVGDEVKEKVLKICQVLNRYQLNCNLRIIPFGKVQELIAQNCGQQYRTLLFRYAMIITANILATRQGCHALCTGDSLGQVASQTMENLALLDGESELPILRPLIGFSKRNIMDLAHKIGTFDLSIMAGDDACALFTPQRPIIRPHREYWQKITRKLKDHLNIVEEIENSIKGSSNHLIDFIESRMAVC